MSYDFKKDEDVKEYIKNLGIEYRFGCFSEKDPQSKFINWYFILFILNIWSNSVLFKNLYLVCQLLGDYLETIENNPDKAAKIYKENCDERNFGRSCYKYASYMEKNNLKNLKPVIPEVMKIFIFSKYLSKKFFLMFHSTLYLSQIYIIFIDDKIF